MLLDVRIQVFNLLRDEVERLGIKPVRVEDFNSDSMNTYNIFIARFCSEIINTEYLEWSEEHWKEFIRLDSRNVKPEDIKLHSLLEEIIIWYPTIGINLKV